MIANTHLVRVGLVVLLPLLQGGCFCFHDVTHDPKFGFEQLAGKCFELKAEEFISDDGNPIEGHYSIFTPRLLGIESMEKYRAHPENYAYAVVKSILPKGTKFRVDKLEFESCENGSSTPYVTMLNGPYQGKRASVYLLLLKPGERNNLAAPETGKPAPLLNPTDKWIIDYQALIPCSEP